MTNILVGVGNCCICVKELIQNGDKLQKIRDRQKQLVCENEVENKMMTTYLSGL